ncbi:hypothetical protein PLICRDRAFT_100491 [Plicaturopsis crispa FD-325 SS-3]|nr:hypothetical protein PLICRDRAFT_100491 [Plicaturopsis crispa FD-325 SS-3]
MASSATLTTDHLPRLRALLQEWQDKQPAPTGFADTTDDHARERAKDVIVAFRTRPPLVHEAQQKFKGNTSEESESGERVDFCAGISLQSADPGVFVAHVPGMKWNGPTLTHKSYTADLAFSAEIDNEEVYQRTVVHPDLLELVLSGGVGCVLAYGQTGSGKTWTMEGIESRIARDLFESARVVGKRLRTSEGGPDSPEGGTDRLEDGVFEFSVTFLELLGRHAVDLVEPRTEVDAQGNPVRKEVAVHEDKVGDVRPRLISTPVSSSEELQSLITASLLHRRTSATLRNATSSRSHAMLTIRVKNKLLPYAEEGQLILVDLAGSERYEDSKAHDKQRMDESRENNKSLMNLKECVRAKAKMAQEDGFVHIPWRSNKLTMLLKPIFDIESRQRSKTVIIAHVSPHIQDTVHSTNTLGYAAPFRTSVPRPRGPAPYDAADPRTWDEAQTRAWFKDEFASTAGVDVDVEKLCPPGMTARVFGGMYTTEFVERVLAAARGGEVEDVKTRAVEVVGRLFYLILSAKTRKRNAIMKSRPQRVHATNAYGQ